MKEDFETNKLEQEELSQNAEDTTLTGEGEASADMSENQDTLSAHTPEETPEEKLSKLSDDYLRLMAEYDNYRKRTLKEKSELIRNGGEKVLKDLLPVVDDLDLALQNIEKAEDIDAVREGIRLIASKFTDYLSRQGVKAIETEGKPFDEELHEAIATFPAPTEEQKGQVIDCVKKGYTLNDKVLRHASVVVGQ